MHVICRFKCFGNVLLSAVLKEIVLMSDQPSFDLMQLCNQNVLGGCENTRDSLKKKKKLD